MAKETFPLDDQAETWDILNMFVRIRQSIDELEDNEREQLTEDKLSFRGFDSHSDQQRFYFLAHYDQKELDYYDNILGIKVKRLNSATALSLRKYRAMVVVCNSFDDLNYILNLEQLKLLQDI